MKTHRLPQVVQNDSQCIRKRRQGFVVPSSLTNRQRASSDRVVSQQRHQREQVQQGGLSACNSLIRPLPLGLNAQVSSHFSKGDFELPTHHKSFHHLYRIDGQNRSDCAFAWSADRSNQQDSCVMPNTFGKDRRKSRNWCTIGFRQGEHWTSSWWREAIAYSAFYNPQMDKVQLRAVKMTGTYINCL